MKLRISVLAILGVALVTAAVVTAMSAVIIRTHRMALLSQLTADADLLSETIVRSTLQDMLLNQREALHREINTIGVQPGIVKVRLINARGKIKFSSDSTEVGRALDKRAEACYACHAADKPLAKLSTKQRARVYTDPDGHRVLGMIRPIHNETSCLNAACHAHRRPDAVLGVLDVNLSLAGVDHQLARDQRQLALLALVAIIASSLALWGLNTLLVGRPVAQLIAGTRKVANGDLTTTIPATATHELGDLARAFNDMVRQLGEAQRQLTQADKLASVGRLAAGVAHEINNPLTGVLTYASFLQKRLQDRPEMAQDLDVIVRETKRCREIVRGLLDFSRQTPPRRQPTDLNDVVRKGLAVIMNQLTLRHVALDFKLTEPLRPIPADANQIQQVIVNLVMNAADAIGEQGGTIHLTTRDVDLPARGHVVLRTATCPKGCDLVDPGVRVGRYPAIRVLRRVGDKDTIVHMDPIYGHVGHRAAEPCEAGVQASYACPRCRTKLDLPERRCGDCGAPVFAVMAGDKGRVEWCTSKGCHWTRCEIADARGTQPFVELVVKDTGHGIAAEDLAHLFEPFFTTKGNRGLGLGLAVTWGIVEGHGGTIDVQSEPGDGASFTVQLPCGGTSPEPAAATTTTTPTPPPAPTPGPAGAGTGGRS